jgi:hypothetical protein
MILKNWAYSKFWISQTDSDGDNLLGKEEKRSNYANWKAGKPNGKETKNKYCPYIYHYYRQKAMEKCNIKKFYPLCQKGNKTYF